MNNHRRIPTLEDLSLMAQNLPDDFVLPGIRTEDYTMCCPISYWCKHFGNWTSPGTGTCTVVDDKDNYRIEHYLSNFISIFDEVSEGKLHYAYTKQHILDTIHILLG